MPQTGRLTSSADVRAVFAARSGAGTAHVVVNLRLRGDDAPARVTVVAGRRVGGAVVRNRAKRRLRECIRGSARIQGLVGHDVVVSAKAGADAEPLPVLCDEVDSAVRRAAKRVVIA